MAQAVIPGDLLVTGSLIASSGVYSGTTSVTNSMVSATAAIASTKLQHRRAKVDSLANQGATPSAVRRVIARVYGATATLVAFRVGLVNVLASGTTTVDLYKNGVSVLSATVQLNSTPGTGGTAYDSVAAAFSSTALVAGDVLEVVGTVSAPSGGGGWYTNLVYDEDAA